MLLPPLALLLLSARPAAADGVDETVTSFSRQAHAQQAAEKTWVDSAQADLTASGKKDDRGCYAAGSAVVGSRHDEQAAVMGLMGWNPAVRQFEKGIYQERLMYLIPKAKEKDAEQAAKAIFAQYVGRYKGAGITPENAVGWTSDRDHNINFTKVERKHGAWAVCTSVGEHGVHGSGGVLPASLTAYHEFMHVEETASGAPVIDSAKPGFELITTMKSLELADRVSKALDGVPLETEVDYKLDVHWDQHSAKLGALINFYRKLEERYGDMGKAVVSAESIAFISQSAASR